MDFTDLYSTRIQKTFDDDQAEILEVFRRKALSNETAKATLINYHKGLPIIYPAKIVSVEHGIVDMDIHPQQAVAIADGRYAFIRVSQLPYAIVARAQYVNVKKHAASLNKLGFIEIMAEKRNAVRLAFDFSEKATVSCNDQKFQADMVDISVQGLAVNFEKFVEFEDGAELSLTFSLPDPVQQQMVLMTLPATLVAINGHASPYLGRFKFTPDKHQEQFLSRYIFHRQVEIIHELKDAVD